MKVPNFSESSNEKLDQSLMVEQAVWLTPLCLSYKMLFKKNLFVMAINLAKSQHLDSDGLSEIFRQYGDHLYLKGDHDGAIQQYIRYWQY